MLYNSRYKNQWGRGSGTYQPKKPVKSFQDLEVYQKSLEAAVFVGKTIVPAVESGKSGKKKTLSVSEKLLLETLVPCALGLPHLIAEAHSLRFGTGVECLVRLERAMMNCNKLVAYVEEVRDICDTGVTWEQFDEVIKKYLYIRRKVLNLQRSWKKYIEIKQTETN